MAQCFRLGGSVAHPLIGRYVKEKAMSDNDKNELSEFWTTSAESGVAGAAAALGLLFSGGTGGVILATLVPFLTVGAKQVFLEYKRISRSQNEHRRTATACVASINHIEHHIKNGSSLRTDNFFHGKQDSRSNAEEILEGVIIRCKLEADEKKAPYLHRVFAQSLFDQSISSDFVHHVLNISTQITYRQLCLMQLFSGNFSSISWLDIDYDAKGCNVQGEAVAILAELYDLYQKGIVEQCERDEPDEDSDTVALLAKEQIKPQFLRLTNFGVKVHYLLGLANMDIEEVLPWHNQLNFT